MGEFFILAKFQDEGIATEVAHKIWEMHHEKWEVSVIPENKKALNFWAKAVTKFTNNNFQKSEKNIDYDLHQPKRIIFEFNTKNTYKCKN